jgi:hypothetical protein
MVPTPAGEEVLAYLGVDPLEYHESTLLAHEHAVQMTSLVRGYTRGRGFTDWQCEEDLAAVIISAAVRSYGNPSQTRRIEAGNYSELPALFDGWTLAELAVLHGYRRRAA